MRGRHGLQVTMLALTGQKRLYHKLFSEWSGYSSGRPTAGRTREATGQRRGRIEYLAIVQSAAVVELYSVVVIGIRAPEEDVDMGTEVDMGVGVVVGLCVGAGRGEIHNQQEG